MNLVVAFPGSEAFASLISRSLGWDIAPVTWHRFPDGETNLRFGMDVRGASISVVATLDRPDPKFLGLAFCAAAARELGAKRVGLVAPYLAYMRQDMRFHEGEAVTARYFPGLVAQCFDWLVTADPHLHRIRDLAEVYDIPVRVVHCAPLMGEWIGRQVKDPFIVGPDEESAQWAGAIAAAAGAPSVVLRKLRRGDRSVDISFPDLRNFTGRTPVLVDDIISTGLSMARTVEGLGRAGFRAPWCVAVHAVFASGAAEALSSAGAGGLATCNTIAHSTNRIDVSGLFTDPVRELAAGDG